MLVKLERDEEALDSFERALKIQPDFANAFLQSGDLLRPTGAG